MAKKSRANEAAHAGRRPEVIVAALLYLITAYRKNRCPSLASCIAQHFAWLSRHPHADHVLRDVAASSIQDWSTAAREGRENSLTNPAFALH